MGTRIGGAYYNPGPPTNGWQNSWNNPNYLERGVSDYAERAPADTFHPWIRLSISNKDPGDFPVRIVFRHGDQVVGETILESDCGANVDVALSGGTGTAVNKAEAEWEYELPKYRLAWLDENFPEDSQYLPPAPGLELEEGELADIQLIAPVGYHMIGVSIGGVAQEAPAGLWKHFLLEDFEMPGEEVNCEATFAADRSWASSLRVAVAGLLGSDYSNIQWLAPGPVECPGLPRFTDFYNRCVVSSLDGNPLQPGVWWVYVDDAIAGQFELVANNQRSLEFPGFALTKLLEGRVVEIVLEPDPDATFPEPETEIVDVVPPIPPVVPEVEKPDPVDHLDPPDWDDPPEWESGCSDPCLENIRLALVMIDGTIKAGVAKMVEAVNQVTDCLSQESGYLGEEIERHSDVITETGEDLCDQIELLEEGLTDKLEDVCDSVEGIDIQISSYVQEDLVVDDARDEEGIPRVYRGGKG